MGLNFLNMDDINLWLFEQILSLEQSFAMQYESAVTFIIQY